MVYFPKWKIILVLLVCVLGIYYSVPNFIPASNADTDGWSIAKFFPKDKINLGLDLQGGSHLLLEVETSVLTSDRMKQSVKPLRKGLRAEGIKLSSLRFADKSDHPYLSLSTTNDFDSINKALWKINKNYELIESSPSKYKLVWKEAALKKLETQAMQQSIEVVRRRIDFTGTSEPLIQQQGGNRILVQLPGVDNPQRVKDLLGQTAKLSLHLVDAEGTAAFYKGMQPKSESLLLPDQQTPGQFLVVFKEIIVSGENLVDAQTGFKDAQPIVNFEFDTMGARSFGDATRNNVGQRLAIVLDNEVISSPSINSHIPGGAGYIQGNFSVQSANNLALLLRSGALPAPIKIIEERSVGPGLGSDSIDAGKISSIIGILLVIGFMIFNYGFFGLLADIALVLNLFLILALMSALQATLTLPGIAGIILTVGMAVDANVLIFERIREEYRQTNSVIKSIDLGFSKALTTIVDSNLTTLIAALILFMLGSGPIKGFAVTLGIGILTSMFSAIMISRLLLVTWLRKRKPAKLNL